MPFLTKKTVTVSDTDGNSNTYDEGTVLSDWEVKPFVRDQIKLGSPHQRALFEPITEREAQTHRRRATAEEGSRVFDGRDVQPPWEDYVGLHPDEIVERMRKADRGLVQQVRDYERGKRGGLSRLVIVNFIAPCEQEPWTNYDQQSVREVLEKFSIISDAAVADAIIYEMEHAKRPAVLEYERDLYESSSSKSDKDDDEAGDLPSSGSSADPAAAGAAV